MNIFYLFFVDLKWVFRLLRVNEASRFSLMKLYDFNAMGFEKLVNQSCLIVIPYQMERIEEFVLSVSICKPGNCSLTVT